MIKCNYINKHLDVEVLKNIYNNTLIIINNIVNVISEYISSFKECEGEIFKKYFENLNKKNENQILANLEKSCK